MKKLTLISAFLLVFLLTTGIASARVSFGFNIPFYFGPPAYPYPSYGYYGPGYYGPAPGYSGYRVWVPGYWTREWTGYAWARVWRPGHWEYR